MLIQKRTVLAVMLGVALGTVAGWATGCSEIFSKTIVIDPISISGSAELAASGERLEDHGVQFNITGALDEFPGTVVLDEIRLRTVFDKDSDKTDEALSDEALMDGCRDGQDRLGFVESVEVRVKAKGADDSTYQLLARGEFDESTPCSILLEPKSIDFQQFEGVGYELRIVPKGVFPDHKLLIGGYVLGHWAIAN